MGFTPFGPVAGPLALQMQATTGVGGFALTGLSQSILLWTAPNDGLMHRFMVFSMLHVSTLEVGGQVNVLFTGPFAGATQHSSQLFAAALGTDTSGQVSSLSSVVAPGASVTIAQTALTSGAALLFAEIWGI